VTYYFVVQASDVGSEGGGTTNSSQATGTTTPDTVAAGVPTLNTPTYNTTYPTGINLSWSTVTDNASLSSNISYEISTSTGSSDYVVTPAGTTSSYLGGGAVTHGSLLTSQTTYGFRVRSIDQAGNVSAWSPTVNGTTATSYATDVAPIFNNICAGCHQGGVTTPGPYSYTFFQNNPFAPAGGVCPTSDRFVVAGNAGASLIWQRMSGQPTTVTGCSASGADQMPQFGPYPQANIDTMANWINQGALNN
jgi:hypothetical protein